MDDQFHQADDPEAVFSVLGAEVRLAVLQRLWESDEAVLPFATLYDRVDIDDSGQFNYHLDKLVGRFVAKTADGYRLTQAGKQVIGAISSGTFTVDGELAPIELEPPCRMCGGDQVLTYDTELLEVECASCASGWQGTVPPAVLADRDLDSVPQVASDHLRTQFRRIATGFCTYCSGHTKPTVGPLADLAVGGESTEASARPTDHPAVQFDCQRCGHRSGLSLDYTLLLTNPDVECFFYDHGIRVREMPIWTVPALDPDHADIVDRDPLRARVSYRLDDEVLTVTTDDALTVQELERTGDCVPR